MSSKIIIALTIALFAGVGIWNLRRNPAAESEAPSAAQARLNMLPVKIGDWSGTENDANPKAMLIAEAEAYLSRSYRGPDGAFSMMILYGTPGALGAHDPQTCYAGTGFEQVGASRRYPSKGWSLWNARFERTVPTKTSLDVYWGWGIGGNWQAPDQARLEFAGQSRIYKIYLQQTIRDREEPKFPAGILEVVQKVLN